MHSARRPRPHPGKVSGPPEPVAAGPAVPDTEALCSQRGGSGERLLGHLGPFWGNPPVCSHFPRRVSGLLLHTSARSTSAAESAAAASRGPLRALPRVVGPLLRTSPTCSRSGPAGAAVLPEPAKEQVQGTPKLLRQGCHPSPGGLAAPTACRRVELPGRWTAGA